MTSEWLSEKKKLTGDFAALQDPLHDRARGAHAGPRLGGQREARAAAAEREEVLGSEVITVEDDLHVEI